MSVTPNESLLLFKDVTVEDRNVEASIEIGGPPIFFLVAPNGVHFGGETNLFKN